MTRYNRDSSDAGLGGARIQKLLSEGVQINSDNFLVVEEREDSNTTESGSSTLNGVSLAGR